MPRFPKNDEEEPVEESSIDRLTRAIERLVDYRASGGEAAQGIESQVLMTKLTSALERVSENQLKGSEAIAQSYRQVHRPSNTVVPMKSVYHPRGETLEDYQKPVLVCPMHLPFKEEPNDNMLTREEVELCNLLVKIPGSYVIRRIDDTKIKLQVKVDYAMDEVTPSKVILSHETGYNNEYFRLMPALHSQLRQMLAQAESAAIRTAATQVLTMDEELALIETGQLSVSV